MRPARASVLGICRDLGALAPRRILWAFLTGALAAGCGVGLLATSGWLITRASLEPPVLSLSIAIGAVQAFALCRGIARYAERLALHDVSLSALGKLRLSLFDTLEPLVPGGLGSNRAGSLLTSFVSDCDTVVDAMARSLGAFVDVTTSAILGLLLAVLIDPVAGGVLAAGSSALVTGVISCARTGRGASEEEASLRAEQADSVVETVRSAPELAVYGRHDLVASELDRINVRSASTAARRAIANGLGRGLVVLGGAVTLIAVVSLALSAHDSHQLSGVLLAVLVFETLAVVESASALPLALQDLVAGSAAVRRLRVLSDLEPPVADDGIRDSALPTEQHCHVDDAELALVGARVSGSGGAAILEEATLVVRSGERACLVGPSGSGKTSAVLALLHFLECSEGCALVGGVDVRTLARSQLAAKIGWLDEEPHVFSTTLAANLRVADPAVTDERCQEVLEAVGLRDLLDSLPEGLETRLGACGRALSAGERQRLAMARALLSGGDVLLLDEPEAHLDARSAAQLLPDLLAASAGRTVLVTGHRPDRAILPDRLFVTEAGHIAEVTPEWDESDQ